MREGVNDDLVTDLLEGETEAEGGEITAVCQLVANEGGIVGFGANDSIGDDSRCLSEGGHVYVEDGRTNRGCWSWTPRMPALMVEAPLSRMTVGVAVGCMPWNMRGWPPDGEVSEVRNAGTVGWADAARRRCSRSAPIAIRGGPPPTANSNRAASTAT